MIWLLRHGDAEAGDGMPDAERDLTEKGERQSRAAGAARKNLGGALDLCLTSPQVRARRTAALACAVMLVGHEPDFSQAVALATGSRVKMKKGGIAAIDDHVLHVLMRPKDLRAIAGD